MLFAWNRFKIAEDAWKNQRRQCGSHCKGCEKPNLNRHPWARETRCDNHAPTNPTEHQG